MQANKQERSTTHEVIGNEKLPKQKSGERKVATVDRSSTTTMITMMLMIMMIIMIMMNNDDDINHRCSRIIRDTRTR